MSSETETLEIELRAVVLVRAGSYRCGPYAGHRCAQLPGGEIIASLPSGRRGATGFIMFNSMIFADLELARQLEQAEAVAGRRFVEARSRLSPEAGAQWIEVAGAHAMFDGAASPVTQTFGLGLFAEPTDADLERLETFFLNRDAPVCHEVSPLAGTPLAERLSRRGYRPVEFTSVMYLPLFGSAAAADVFNPHLRTRPMAEGEEELWSEIFARGWDEHPEWTDFLRSSGRMTASSAGSLGFFAHLDGEPVAAAMLRCDEGVALLGGACTIAEARRQGAQGMLLAARMAAAVERKCDLAMMCAQPGSASQRNAERRGFRIAYTRTKWQLATPL